MERNDSKIDHVIVVVVSGRSNRDNNVKKSQRAGERMFEIDKLKMNILYFVLLQNEAIYHKIEGGVGFGETRKKEPPIETTTL